MAKNVRRFLFKLLHKHRHHIGLASNSTLVIRIITPLPSTFRQINRHMSIGLNDYNYSKLFATEIIITKVTRL